MERYQQWMDLALAQAAAASGSGDVPIGAVVADESGALIAAAGNERELHGDPTAHAELIALRRAAQARGSWRMDGLTLVVTLEPCPMCAGAILQARVPRLVFGAWDEKAGAVGSVVDLLREVPMPHRVEVVAGVREAECAALLRDFFASRRD